jgi:hypothetical protein
MAAEPWRQGGALDTLFTLWKGTYAKMTTGRKSFGLCTPH